jgi:hypothetical protein
MLYKRNEKFSPLWLQIAVVSVVEIHGNSCLCLWIPFWQRPRRPMRGRLRGDLCRGGGVRRCGA